ncbi:uncharacterized protein PAC_01538 [Phialocephala subalpina]|uniref:Uncharacterized protein n=1 Tax=Phialocephala subalpina TaxID=576137 RepID=A0A1L7WFW4_9HELO|nr:uncharacterized protein PAC_01538 [Phialocephala subalpina]
MSELLTLCSVGPLPTTELGDIILLLELKHLVHKRKAPDSLKKAILEESKKQAEVLRQIQETQPPFGGKRKRELDLVDELLAPDAKKRKQNESSSASSAPPDKYHFIAQAKGDSNGSDEEPFGTSCRFCADGNGDRWEFRHGEYKPEFYDELCVDCEGEVDEHSCRGCHTFYEEDPESLFDNDENLCNRCLMSGIFEDEEDEEDDDEF